MIKEHTLPQSTPIPSFSNENICFHVGEYSYGFNSQEKEAQITGGETHTSAEFWMYDARVGRRWQLDPKPSFTFSSYCVFLNSPILYNDPLGDTVKLYNYQGPTTTKQSSEFNADPTDILNVIDQSLSLEKNQQRAFLSMRRIHFSMIVQKWTLIVKSK